MEENRKFESVQIIRDDQKRWMLFIRPCGERFIQVYPDDADVHFLMKAVRKENDFVLARVELYLANKYYKAVQEGKCVNEDIFGTPVSEDVRKRICKVHIYRRESPGYLLDKCMCYATIDNLFCKPREVSFFQWNAFCLAEDKYEYKLKIAASLFADVIEKRRIEEEMEGCNKKSSAL